MSYFEPETAPLGSNNPVIGWHSVLTTANITAESSTSARPVINLWSPDTAALWEPDSDASYLLLENPDGVQVDYIGIARHNLGSLGIELQVESSDDAGATWDEIVPQHVIGDDSAIIQHFTATNAHLFRVNFVQPDDGIRPILAHIKLGKLLQLQRSIYVGHKPAALAQYAEGTTQTSESGQYLGRINTAKWRKASVSQTNVTADFVYTYVAPFAAHANNTAPDDGTAQGPYFFAWRPLSHPADTLYGWTHGTIHPDNQQPNGMMGFSFDIEAIA